MRRADEPHLNFLHLFYVLIGSIVKTHTMREAPMARLRLDIPKDRYERLMEIAVQERRPIDWQAEVILMRAIDEYFLPMLQSRPPERESAGVST